MLSSGKPAQHSGEMEADLEKAEGMIRFLFNDVQLLKDGRHLQAEQMYRRSEIQITVDCGIAMLDSPILWMLQYSYNFTKCLNTTHFELHFLCYLKFA